MPERLVVGWDVGGAHLKAALARDGRILDAMQVACALWQGLDRLDAALDAMLARWPDAHRAAHAATMTGELADCFEHRQHGVASIAGRLAACLGMRLRWFDAGGGWIEAAHVDRHWARIASANWLATARWLASRAADALLVDVGSTTTDLVPIAGGVVVALGNDDATRLTHGELVYHGVARTPLCAFGPRIEFGGVERNVMNELFATAADVYRLTGELDEAHDAHPAPDGAGKDRAATQRRLARMIGLDGRDGSDDDWLRFARYWRARQLDLLVGNAARVVEGRSVAADAPVIGAGCGDFLARALAASMRRRYRSIDDLMPIDGDATLRAWARVAAPSVAVALLASQEDAACGW